MKKRGQFSVEYIMIIAVSMMIIVPGVFLFRNYVFESNDRLLQNKVDEVSSIILSKARKVYYYGPPSKSVFQADMPSGISNLYILSNAENEEYYLVFMLLTSAGEKEYIVESGAPIKAADPALCNIEGCQGECECFDSSIFSKGLKNFRVEASEEDGFFYVSIKEISPELV